MKLQTRAEVAAGPICTRCGKKHGWTQEDHDEMIARNVKLLQDAIDETIYQRVLHTLAHGA